jgi:4-hydroxy-2-oxoheptanedioate aldolase
MRPSLRQVWEQGDITIGGWCSIGSPVSAELMARLGFHWVCVDTQHGLISYEQMLAMIQAIASNGTPSLVRVAWNDPGLISRALDAGADGVVVPMVNTVDEAKRAVGACRYPPDGYRSWGPIRNQLTIDGFSPEMGNSRSVCTIMIETRQAVERIDDILAVPGINAVYVGPNDLSVSFGLQPGGLLTDPVQRKVFDIIADSCKRHGVVAGIHCADIASAVGFRDAGYRMLNVAGDLRFMRQGATEVVKQLISGTESPRVGPEGYT